MSRRTKKVGIAGRFGARYGVKPRKMFNEVMKKKSAVYKCPMCSYRAVKRRETSIWSCRHCGHTFAGGAFVPSTTIVGKIYTGGRGASYDGLKERLLAAQKAGEAPEEEKEEE